MGRVVVDFGVGQGAKRSADIRSDLGQASNAGQHQKRRNPEGAKQKGTSVPQWRDRSLQPQKGDAPHSLLAIRPFCFYARPIPVFQQSPNFANDPAQRLAGYADPNRRVPRVRHRCHSVRIGACRR